MIFLNKILDYTPGRKGAIHDGKYLCSQCGRTYVYDTELGDIAKKHRMQLRSEVDDVITAESSEPMIVNFADQYYTITCFSLSLLLLLDMFFVYCCYNYNKHT